MAKYTVDFDGNYDDFLNFIEKNVIEGSMSVSIEDKHQCCLDDVQCTVFVFERYSYTGGNRVSLNITILGNKNHIHLIAVTAGGSQAMFFKINTFGEDSFLDKLKYPVEEYIAKLKKER